MEQVLVGQLIAADGSQTVTTTGGCQFFIAKMQL
jgi:hypothetical protein